MKVDVALACACSFGCSGWLALAMNELANGDRWQMSLVLAAASAFAALQSARRAVQRGK